MRAGLSDEIESATPETLGGDAFDVETQHDEFASDVFARGMWSETLTKFSRATGLVISLFDQNLTLRSSVTSASPITDRLTKAGFFNEDGLGGTIDREIAARVLRTREWSYSVEIEMFSHLAIPLIHDDEVRAVFIIGWVPEKFADPVLCDHLAKRLGVAPMEIWQLMRMQQPVSKEKLETHAKMLETFATPMLLQVMDQLRERRRALRAQIISETALKFAEASTEAQICAAAFQSIQRLIRCTSLAIDVIHIKEDREDVRTYRQDMSAQNRSVDETVLKSHLTIPIPAPIGRPVGRFEMTIGDDEVSEESLQDLQTIASQFGIALQKVVLVHVLESERVALKGANAQLEHMHKMKDEFLATISHELRTPLNAILGWAQILEEEGPGIAEFQTAMATISRNALSQSHLIEDLLDVSRIISGKMILERSDLEATSLLRQSLETVFPMTEARRQKVHVQISKAPIFFKGDATRVTQIFWNLLSNASKFTLEGGDISVVLENAGHYFKFEITDSGKGIPAEFLPRLFDRFSQADGSFTRRHGGLGLGLAIVRHLVELHGGTVSAESEGDGKGSRFTIYLPQKTSDLELDTAQELARLSPQIKPRADRKLEGFRILLVDDEPDALRLTRFVLERYGAETKIADTAEQAFTILKEWRPDILVSDLSMPHESGFDLIRRVRALSPDEGGSTPAIALTALATREQKDLAREAGFQLHLLKPAEPNALVESIATMNEVVH